MEYSNNGIAKQPLRLLWENHSADVRHGATCDGLDLVRFSERDELEVVFCGPSSSQLSAAVESLGCEYLAASSREFSRSGLPLYGLSVLAWMRRLRSLRIDAVFLNYTSWGPSVAYAAKRLRIPVLARAGGTYTNGNLTYRWVDKYVANCDQQACGLLHSPVADRVKVAGSFLDISTARSTRSDGPLPSRRPNTPLALFAGQLVERKGIHVLMEALMGLEDNIDVWLVGGEWETGQYPARIRANASGLPDSCHVHFVNHRSDMLRLIEACDIFVLPSLSEARPRAIMEAMLMGKCVLATNVGGVPTLIEDNTTGRLVEANDACSLRRVLHELLVTPSLRSQLGKRAKQYGMSHFDSTQTAAKYVTEIRELTK